MTSPTSTQLDHLRHLLEDRQRELAQQQSDHDAETREAGSRDPHNEVEDSAEQADDRFRDAMRQAVQERDLGERRQITEALARMEEGSYGACIDCGRDIPYARLEVQPFAARCLACQERYEQAHPEAGAHLPSNP